MKKQILFLASVLAIGFTACDDKSDLGIIQTNPQETIVSADGVTVNILPPITTGAVNIEDFENSVIPVLSYTTDETVPTDAVVSFKMQVASSGAFADALTIPMVKINDSDFGVYGSDWDAAFRHIIGKTPDQTPNYIRIAGYYTIGSQVTRVGTDNTWLGGEAIQIKVTPVDLNIKVEPTYYLVSNLFELDGQSALATAVKMEHSDAHNQYDDPNFSYVLDIPAELGSFTWQIVPGSIYEAASYEGWFGPETANEMTGMLVENGKPGELGIAGQYLLNVNMETLEYSVSMAVDMLYTPGGGNGWGFASGMLATYNYVDYFGFTVLSGEFKITDRPAWGGIEWGAGDADNHIMAVGGGNIPGPTKGLYWMNVSLTTLEYNWKLIENIGVIGSFEGNNWVSDECELESEDYLVWKGIVNFTTEGIEWKFRTNNAWEAPNLGYQDVDDPYSSLVNDGGNLPEPGIGTYEVTLDLTTVPYHVSFEKK